MSGNIDCQNPADRAAELRRAQALHDALSAAVQPGKHVNRTALYRTMSPLLAAAGIQISRKVFSTVFNKWRKDPRPETLARRHPVRHRSSVKSNIRHVRTYAIRNGVTLRAAWMHFKESKVPGVPSFSTVLQHTPDAAAVDLLANISGIAEKTNSAFREHIRAFDAEIKATCDGYVAEMRKSLLRE